MRIGCWADAGEKRGFLGTYVMIGDETSLSVNAQVNTRNVTEYARAGHLPSFNFEINTNQERVIVWVALCGIGEIVGSFFFELET